MDQKVEHSAKEQDGQVAVCTKKLQRQSLLDRRGGNQPEPETESVKKQGSGSDAYHLISKHMVACIAAGDRLSSRMMQLWATCRHLSSSVPVHLAAERPLKQLLRFFQGLKMDPP